MGGAIVPDVLHEANEHPCARRWQFFGRMFSGEHEYAQEQWAFVLLNWLHFACFDAGLTPGQWRWISEFAQRCVPDLLRHAGQELAREGVTQLARRQGPPTRKRAIFEQRRLRIVEDVATESSGAPGALLEDADRPVSAEHRA